jgi:hypothetical protein
MEDEKICFSLVSVQYNIFLIEHYLFSQKRLIVQKIVTT